MTIWLLAIVLILSLAGLGYRQGAIRVAFSLVGILLGALLCIPLGKPMAILLKAFGVTHPVVLWLVPPVIAFVIISALFKVGALAVHHKVEVYYKYKTGDLRMSLWERLNRRLGLCLGIVNGVAYMVLISFVVYVISYWTVQMETSGELGESPKLVRLVTRMGHDLQTSSFSKTARALDRMPASFYEAADIAGKLYQNPLLEARLSRYPAFLMLGELPEFQTLAADQTFTEMRTRGDSAAQLNAYGPMQAITGSPDMLQKIWSIVEPNLKDLGVFLETGKSDKFAEEPILGRWNCSIRQTVAAIRRARPNITAREMAAARVSVQSYYSKARLVVGTENQVVVKEFPNLKSAPGSPIGYLSAQGTWTGANGNYSMDFNLGGTDFKSSTVIEGDRMTVTMDKASVVFEREF